MQLLDHRIDGLRWMHDDHVPIRVTGEQNPVTRPQTAPPPYRDRNQQVARSG
ncbi:hypothetical protein AB0M46_38805 [Dactylosporangium sp. NPDC051485]|uniref:hypothetical protein n=1 Tax=Dactylosporangium sp. NPDC051485 TaxID=3154846 RepID=UPI0034148D7B